MQYRFSGFENAADTFLQNHRPRFKKRDQKLIDYSEFQIRKSSFELWDRL